MDKQLIEQQKQKLLTEKQRLQSLMERTAKHLYKRDEPYSADFAEQAVEVSNNEVVEHLDDDAKRELVEINTALDKIEQGSYGVCDSCDENINEKRLDVIPYAGLCIKCAEASS